MPRIHIEHRTHYRYTCPVTFGPHMAMMRPREGHDLRIHSASVEVVPAAEIRWARDVYGNSMATVTFLEPSPELIVHSKIDIDLIHATPFTCLLSDAARFFPFVYSANEQLEILPYRMPSYPHDTSVLLDWLSDLHAPGSQSPTLDLLMALNSKIHGLRYEARDEHGVRLPCQTLALGSGSCRDFAVLMMEAVRHWGFAARFVSGYILLQQGQHGATHAWTEVYLPGMGWVGFDPTNDKLASTEHIAVAVARDQEKAMPLFGTWQGPTGAFASLEVIVQVFEVGT